MQEAFNQLKQLIMDTEADLEKAATGNKAAGTRVRKAMQDVKKLAQEVRVKALDVRD